ncbi:MAG TPA: NAD(P)H-binding protein [Flavipsychrobacter sp.]|nr:NAD(P)H-binding protein [Flavipsychrobacter sp.]
MNKEVFITGGTGYIGKRFINLLLKDGYSVKALIRKGSENKLPEGCSYIVANPFNENTFAKDIPAGCTFIQLLGTSHPGPKKKDLFKTIDLLSAQVSAKAAKLAGAGHFVYVSVAQTPTNVMKDFQQCRAEGEIAIKETGVKATFIRPWYVVGPGHYWPLFFLPVFKILELIPATSKKAKALRLVSLHQMLKALLYVVQNPPDNLRIMEIDQIRKIK